MNKLRIKKQAGAGILAAALLLNIPFHCVNLYGADSAVQLQNDWTWTVQKNQTDSGKIPSGQDKKEIKDPFAPAPRIDAPVVQKTGDTCKDPGTTDGFYRCVKTFSNGFSVMISNDQEHHGDEFKRQTRIAEFDPAGKAQSRKTIRHKVKYIPFSGDKKIDKEFFDIVNRPKNRAITREVIIYEYHAGTSNLKSVSWTSYEQIPNTQMAMITRHVALNFDSEGNPLQGRAEKWRDQVPAERLFFWDRSMSGPVKMDDWKMWQEAILKASPRQVF